jgi:dihydroorotate dehydrogenase
MALERSGSASVECGTVTPRPQPGNPTPRLFRLPQAEALINRLGLQQRGVERFLANVAARRGAGILGLNIGKNFDTPNARAVDDYLACLSAVYSRASYVTVNISSPNTRDCASLQSEEALTALLRALKKEQSALSDRHGKYTPIAVKIAPDLSPQAIESVARLLAGTTSMVSSRPTRRSSATASRACRRPTKPAGLSGRPLRARSTGVVASSRRRSTARCRSSASAASCRAPTRRKRSTRARR